MKYLATAAILIALSPTAALAKLPHTVGFNNGSNDTVVDHAPSNMGEAANFSPYSTVMPEQDVDCVNAKSSLTNGLGKTSFCQKKPH